MIKIQSSRIIIGTMMGVTLLVGTILASVRVEADNDSVVDEINITVPVSCTISGTGRLCQEFCVS